MKYLFVVLCVASMACVKSRTDVCPNAPQYQVLTPAVKDWLPYSNNKNLIFETPAQLRDTLTIVKLMAGDDSIWNGDKCPITRGQFVRVDFLNKQSGDTVRTQLGYQDEFRIVTRKSNLIFYDTKNVIIEASAYKKFSVSETINGVTFQSVISLECSPADNCNGTGITKLYFAKSKGLVAFVRNGQTYLLK